jgi:hypothetical protein
MANPEIAASSEPSPNPRPARLPWKLVRELTRRRKAKKKPARHGAPPQRTPTQKSGQVHENKEATNFFPQQEIRPSIRKRELRGPLSPTAIDSAERHR